MTGVPSLHARIDIDMDRACSKCGAEGALENGLCLECAAKRLTEHQDAQDAQDKAAGPRLTKIKARKGKAIHVRWTEDTKAGGVEVHKMDCNKPALAVLYEEMDVLRAFVIEACDLPIEYEQDMTISGLTISKNGDGERVITVTALKKVSCSDAPLVINTPLAKPFNHDTAVDRVELQALRYVNGMRDTAQTELDFGDGDEGDNEGEDV